MSGPDTWGRPTVAISRCLLGDEVRFNGGHTRDRFLTDVVAGHVDWHPLCPEAEVGMGVPREAVHLVDSLGAPRMVGTKSGTDWTDSMTAWSERKGVALAEADIDGLILKKNSPSCGVFGIKVYAGKDQVPLPERRDGLFAHAAKHSLPGKPIEEEGRLNDAGLREAFFDHLFAAARLRAFLAAAPRPADLVAFHSTHKYTLLARSPQGSKELGRLVATAGAVADFAELLAAYRHAFLAAMSQRSHRGRHVNTLQHFAGFVSDPSSKAQVGSTIEQYRQGLVPLVVPVVSIRQALERDADTAWALEQTYLDPYPPELLLRNTI